MMHTMQQLLYLQHMGIYPWIHKDTLAARANAAMTRITSDHTTQESLLHDDVQNVENIQTVDNVQPCYDYRYVQGHRDLPYWVMINDTDGQQYQPLLDQILLAIGWRSPLTAIVQIHQAATSQSFSEHATVSPQQVIVFGVTDVAHHSRQLALTVDTPTIMTLSLATLVESPDKKAQVWQDLYVVRCGK